MVDDLNQQPQNPVPDSQTSQDPQVPQTPQSPEISAAPSIENQTPPVENQTIPPENSQPVEQSQTNSITEPQSPLSSEVSTKEDQVPEMPQQSQAESVQIPQVRFPFNGNYPLTFSFGSQPTTEELKQKFSSWGITGHHGLDFGLSEGTEVLAVDFGKIIQSEDNGDFGISVTIQHSWGQSLYAHLQESKAIVDQTVNASDVIGLSGQTGSAFGAHLHFAIKPNNPDPNNGYLGFIDPLPYLPPITPISQTESIQSVQLDQPNISQSTQSPPIPQNPEPVSPPIDNITPTINIEPQIPQVAQSTDQQIQQQAEDPELNRRVDEKIKANWQQYQPLGNQTKSNKKNDNLNKILQLAQKQKEITNQDVRDLVHVSQSTATEYLQELVKTGKLKTSGRGKNIIYQSMFSL